MQFAGVRPMNSDNQTPNKRKEYASPRLTVYGNIRDITRANGVARSAMDGAPSQNTA